MTKKFKNEVELLSLYFAQILSALREYEKNTDKDRDYASGADKNRARFERLRIESTQLMKQISKRIYKWRE